GVVPHREDFRPVGAEERVFDTAIRRDDGDFRTVARPPDARSLVARAGDDLLAVGAEAGSTQWSVVLQHVELLAGGGVPNTSGDIRQDAEERDDARAVGAETGHADFVAVAARFGDFGMRENLCGCGHIVAVPDARRPILPRNGEDAAGI